MERSGKNDIILISLPSETNQTLDSNLPIHQIAGTFLLRYSTSSLSFERIMYVMKTALLISFMSIFGSNIHAWTITSPFHHSSPVFNIALHSSGATWGDPEPIEAALPKSEPAPERISTADLFDKLEHIVVQGGALRTCAFDEEVGRVAVLLKSEGRPLTATVDLWQGPDNAPQKMSVYLEKGHIRPFRCIVEAPGSSNAIAIRNTAQLEYPMVAALEVDMARNGESPSVDDDYTIVQGGSVFTQPFEPKVQSVKVSLATNLRPLNARIELLQGPNNVKEVVEVYSEQGKERPFNLILETPGVGNVVRIVNTASVEYPFTAALEPYIIDDNFKLPGISGTGMTWR